MSAFGRRAAAAFSTLIISALAHASPVTSSELASICANAEDQAHCGRLVEAKQLSRLSRIAERDGDDLRVSLTPFGLTVFRDTVNVNGAKSYAVWDYLDDLDTLVLFTTDGDRTGFMLVQRRGGEEYRVPSEPILAPDRRHFVTADICPNECENQVSVWRIAADGVRKESTWIPPSIWSDVSVIWKGSVAIALDYSSPNETQRREVTRRLDDPSWTRTPSK